MIETLDSLDKQLMVLLNFDGCTYIDNLWYYFTNKWTWIPLYVSIVFVLFRQKRHWSELLLHIVAVTLIIVMCDQIASHLIKPLVCRLRPSHDEEISDMLYYVNDYRAGLYGFVSSHASNTCGLTVFIWYLFRSKYIRWSFVVWTILTCYSRIYLGVHYPGDIIGGAIVGILSGLLVMEIHKRVLLFLQDKYSFESADMDKSGNRFILPVMALTILYLLIFSNV